MRLNPIKCGYGNVLRLNPNFSDHIATEPPVLNRGTYGIEMGTFLVGFGRLRATEPFTHPEYEKLK